MTFAKIKHDVCKKVCYGKNMSFVNVKNPHEVCKVKQNDVQVRKPSYIVWIVVAKYTYET